MSYFDDHLYIGLPSHVSTCCGNDAAQSGASILWLLPTWDEVSGCGNPKLGGTRSWSRTKGLALHTRNSTKEKNESPQRA